MSVDQKRLATEIIATLGNIKWFADLIRRCADIPENLIRRFLTERNPATGGKLSKRSAAAMAPKVWANNGRGRNDRGRQLGSRSFHRDMRR
ncbi:hypothetical protein [Novosphingobium sp. BL-52-GroH]|uniref:hypothetical protein n=1 Tax=Novosphingobium sp. BL-52-GroH TaxID=3349877 RepID=UPI00384D4444